MSVFRLRPGKRAALKPGPGSPTTEVGAAAVVFEPAAVLSGRCANCGAALSGVFCADCGQHMADLHRSVWRFVADFLDNALCWDNKLLRTLGPLFRQPGFVTREYMAGRRVRYVHPLRLFLFTSAVCLTLLQFSHDHLVKVGLHRLARGKQDRGFQWVIGDDPKPAAEKKKQTSRDDGVEVDPGRARVGNPVKPEETAPGRPDGLEARIGRSVETKIAKNGGEAGLNKAISDGVQHRLSWVALALLPVFALGLRALYWRKDAFYFAHLVFSLHYHTFLLLFWTAYVVLGILADHVWLGSLLRIALDLSLLLPPYYLFRALRRMYGEGRGRTFAKMLVLGSAHLVVILISLAVVGGVTFFFV